MRLNLLNVEMTRSNPADGVTRKGMNSAVFWLVIIGPILIALAGAAWYGGSRTFGLWTGFSGIVLLILAAAIQIQQSIWNTESAPPSAAPPPAKEAPLPQKPQQPSRPVPEQGPIAWRDELSFWSRGGSLLGVELKGTNVSATPVRLADAYIISDITGEKKALQVELPGLRLASISDINQIPPNASLELIVTFGPTGISAPDFVANWGSFQFHAEYGGGTRYDTAFTRETVEKFTRMQFPEVGPHITPKSQGK